MASRVIRLQVPWIWTRIVLFLLIEAILLWIYAFESPKARETIIFGATIVGAAFALYSFLRSIEDRRTQEAARMIERWNAPERSDIRRTLNEITEGQIDPATLQRTTKGEEISQELRDKRAHVVAALNFYEELAISVLESGIDEDRAYRFFKTVIHQTYEALMSWIENERRIDKNRTYYVEFQRLAERWRDRDGC